MHQGQEKFFFFPYRETRYRTLHMNYPGSDILHYSGGVIFQAGMLPSSFVLPCCAWQQKRLFFYSPQTVWPVLSEQYGHRSWEKRRLPLKNHLSHFFHSWTAVKSIVFSSRSHACAENERVRYSKHERAIIIYPDILTERPTGSCDKLLASSTHITTDSKRMTPLGSSSRENFPAVLGRHSLSESMFIPSFSIPRLIGSFHRLELHTCLISSKFQGA